MYKVILNTAQNSATMRDHQLRDAIKDREGNL
jgi:hypothetical protein